MTAAAREGEQQPTADLAVLRLEHFKPLVGESFRLAAEGLQLELRLEAAEALGPAAREAGRPPFSLVFSAPAQPRLAQQVHPLEQVALGRLEVFLVPIAPHGDRARYEAIFA